MKKFLDGELTPLQKERNEKGVCINCGKFHTEPIFDINPIYGPDGAPAGVECVPVGFEKLCELCDEILHNTWPIVDCDIPY